MAGAYFGCCIQLVDEGLEQEQSVRHLGSDPFSMEDSRNAEVLP